MKTIEDLKKIKNTKKRPVWLVIILRITALPFVFCLGLTSHCVYLFHNMMLFLKYGGVMNIYQKHDLATHNLELKLLNDKLNALMKLMVK